MIKRKISEDTYSLDRVPKEARVSLVNVTLVRMGMATALSQFMLGATLGHGMTFWNAMLATCLGSLLLEFVALGLGLAGMKEGLSISLLARWTGFGRLGSALIGLAIAISLLGWFGVQNSILAEGLSYALDYKINFGWITAFSGILLTVLVAFGFRALSWTAKISVPLFCLVVGWIIFYLFKDGCYLDLMNSSPKGNPLTLGEGTTIISGVVIIGALITPDISRYCKNNNHVFWMITLSVIVGEFIINAIAILMAHALETADIVTIMTHSAGWIGLLSVILSAIKINDINLYSSSLGLSNTIKIISKKKTNYVFLTVSLGMIGTSLSVFGILNYFVDFLSMLGVIFPPIAGVMLVDYYILKTSRKLLDETREQGLLPNDSSTHLIGWSAIIACIVGTFVGVIFRFGIPSLNSILVAGITYWLLMKFRKQVE
ncbi:cytosine permease (plasmid) [Arsenophonus nasoniae]|uniref:Cytosine permease n=1 Tax=Arsenophonus nasoniae TaxID=638 RepID=D2U0S9_9GAMM|nr:cytosine permease [Arsenophonus nasoniae]QBY46576.1 Cytosine permease [Arsenophonus nasoniae]WGM08410.1 cytosine permease [Arsenophonus nasoniae]WGM13274.1 cytosine permease [Arsenophonus nasoniae]WGM17809.1 cytosine permease [Arsenophonus nasoniae]CBA74077.1 putative purine and pyrimidine permease [Arsenophonus nasoniae]